MDDYFASDPIRDLDFSTRSVRSGSDRTSFGEHGEAMFLTSSFVFRNAAEAAARFGNQEPGYVYSRFTNPTVRQFERRLASLEEGEACIATASGMSAIMTTALALLKAGDHMVCASAVFGSTYQLFGMLSRFGVRCSFVPLSDLAAWEAAIEPATRLFYVETPSNPLTELADLAGLALISKPRGIHLVVDNCFCTPALQKPLLHGADIVIHSATKYIDGQGRVLGGAIVGQRSFLHDQVLPLMRTTGPSLSAFNAWVLLKGLETLQIRMDQQSANAFEVAQYLVQHRAVARVYYPGLTSHPQHELAKAQQGGFGAVVSFELRGEDDSMLRQRAWSIIDATRLISITGNLGDTKSTITHPASTTHGRLSPQARLDAGIGEGLIRLAVGLESARDICTDLARGLDGMGQ
ncbi:MAG: O-succinylhomoserine sulfhydrylase [Betaproteobacteria bacterium]|jgi:O-succinylhomoserine sulfhydrylase|nr:O-succinylhomoserine sulfhydrylase [Pseudomonadota bacterium]NBO04631.1 O-succinylhomoserine sulfhydrylase [Betaproteobacteria bacterium]NBO95963.1 O-succinylhomoserine sulfhydrylase [Betaproteobacteria bacterium]NBP34178.1 O-succinylhomoserine sulfhydrylase [Betaproteobacteria bacterium]NBP37322.1 O-succinylhomoserine sulfhydrylase [Betaproteobacteria bacterium]